MTELGSQVTKNGSETKGLPPITYDPRGIFNELWALLVPAWLGGKGRDEAWTIISSRDPEHESGGRELGRMSEEQFRQLLRAHLHIWCSVELEKMAKQHTALSRSHQTIAVAEIRGTVGDDTCAAYDLATGTVFECNHENPAPPKIVLDLVDMLKKATGRAT
jgi:hypothetical protein